MDLIPKDLSKDEREFILLQYFQRKERQALYSANYRAKMAERGKRTLTVVVSESRRERVKKIVKYLEDNNLQGFALSVFEARGADTKPRWYLVGECAWSPEHGG